MSRPGLKKHVDKNMEEDKNNSKKDLTNPDGSYILKKDGTPKKDRVDLQKFRTFWT